MASVVTEIAATLLIYTCVVQGIRSLQIDHKESLNAAIGQNISLPCIVTEKHEVHINQMEWHIEKKKLVVFNPKHPTHYHVPDKLKLELVNRTNSSNIQGSILHLYNVTEEDSGIYVCEISSFPAGSSQINSRLNITEPWISAKVVSPGESLIEGDEVNVTCASHPSADRYKLSLQNGLLLESQSGQFTIQNITRHSSDLICQPLWTSSNQQFQSLQANLQMTVDFIDSIKCNSSSRLEVETGTNLTITCEAASSRPLYYLWKKGNLNVSQNSTVSLWSVSPDHSGIYSVIVYAKHHSRLQSQKDFEVTVFNRTDADHLSSTITMETTSQITDGTTLTTAGPGTTLMTVTQPGRTSSPAYHTTTENSLFYNTTAPSAGNITTAHGNSPTVHVKVTVKSNATWSSLNTSADGSTRSEGCCQSHNTTSSLRSTREVFTHAQPITTKTSFMSTSTLVTKPTEQSDSTTVVVVVLIPILLLLVLIGFLYRRYLIQKRMDMPPPFKPPPPPVKYTSVRSQDIPLTDILV